MKNKKSSIVKICHLILLFVGAGICIYGCTLNESSVFDITSLVIKIFALVSSFVYLIKGYKKDADKYYKVFMWILGISEVIGFASLLNKGIQLPFNQAIIAVLKFAAFVLIIGANDYGKLKSNIISIALIVFTGYAEICLMVSSELATHRAIFSLSQFIFALIVAIMVFEKYSDKESRGAK